MINTQKMREAAEAYIAAGITTTYPDLEHPAGVFATECSAPNVLAVLDELERYRSALEYINALAAKKQMHLGRPRPSDRECLYCASYFALNNGAYGHYISAANYQWAKDELCKDKADD
jgi:hypothetical protein